MVFRPFTSVGCWPNQCTWYPGEIFLGVCSAGRGVLAASGIHTFVQLDKIISNASFQTGGVLECNLAHRCSVVSCVCLVRLNITRCTVSMQRVSLGLCSGICITWCFSANRHSNVLLLCSLRTAGVLCPKLYHCGMTLVTLCSFVWCWQELRAGRANTLMLVYSAFKLLVFSYASAVCLFLFLLLKFFLKSWQWKTAWQRIHSISQKNTSLHNQPTEEKK